MLRLRSAFVIAMVILVTKITAVLKESQQKHGLCFISLEY